MINILKMIGSALAATLLVIWTIIILPFMVVFWVVESPFRKKRSFRLSQHIKDTWIPAGKFYYIQYNSATTIVDYIENDFKKKYGAHCVFHRWDDEDFSWSIDSGFMSKQLESDLIYEYSGDCEGLVSFYVLPVDLENQKFEPNRALMLYGPPNQEMYESEADDIKMNDRDAVGMIDNYMNQALRTAQVSLSKSE